MVSPLGQVTKGGRNAEQKATNMRYSFPQTAHSAVCCLHIYLGLIPSSSECEQLGVEVSCVKLSHRDDMGDVTSVTLIDNVGRGRSSDKASTD